MPNTRDTNTRTPTSPAREDRAASALPARGQEEDLAFGSSEVMSMGHTESVAFTIEGELYDAWMPRIARSADGLVPVLPIRRLEDGVESLLIVPGAFNSWLRREKPKRGTKLELRRKGVDEHTGAWKLAVVRL